VLSLLAPQEEGFKDEREKKNWGPGNRSKTKETPFVRGERRENNVGGEGRKGTAFEGGEHRLLSMRPVG